MVMNSILKVVILENIHYISIVFNDKFIFASTESNMNIADSKS